MAPDPRPPRRTDGGESPRTPKSPEGVGMAGETPRRSRRAKPPKPPPPDRARGGVRDGRRDPPELGAVQAPKGADAGPEAEASGRAQAGGRFGQDEVPAPTVGWRRPTAEAPCRQDPPGAGQARGAEAV